MRSRRSSRVKTGDSRRYARSHSDQAKGLSARAPQLVAELAERGAGFRSLRDTWADSTTPHGKLMLTVLGGSAEFERSLIVARTSDGRTRAKDRGVRFGRPRKLTSGRKLSGG